MISLMYHYIRDKNNSFLQGSKSVSPIFFSRQINNFILNGLNPYKIEDFKKVILDNTTLDYRKFLITFDDGLKEHYKCAIRLHKMKIGGIFFVPSQPILEGTILDVHKIHLILEYADTKELFKTILSILDKKILDELSENLINYDFDTTFQIKSRYDKAEISFIKDLLQWQLPKQVKSETINFLFSKYVPFKERNLVNYFYLSKDNLIEMNKMGMEIGLHGYSHTRSEKISLKLQKKEIDKSLEMICFINIKPVNLLYAYPYGSTSNSFISLLKSNNIIGGFCDNGGAISSNKYDSFRLPRLDCRYKSLNMYKNFKLI